MMKYMFVQCMMSVATFLPLSLAAGEHRSFREQTPEEIANHIIDSNPNTDKQRIKNAELFLAIARREKEVVKSLLESNANPTCKIDTDEQGLITPIYAARVHGHEDIAVLLEQTQEPCKGQ